MRPRVHHPRLKHRVVLLAAAFLAVAGVAAGVAGAAQRPAGRAVPPAATGAASAPQGRAASQAARSAPLVAYRGLGSWVDLYDPTAWNDPAAAVQDMASHGVRTLFIETANYHNPSSSTLYRPAANPDALEEFIQACHARGMYVVAWYLPSFKNLEKDLRRSKAAIDLRTSDGQKFDSFALDIEDSTVKPASTRSAQMKKLSQQIRAYVGATYPLGGIIPSPKGMTINSTYWPDFPYKTVADIYDVVVPMGYYTYHVDGYAKVYNESLDNVRIVREQVGRSTVPIHLIAGLGNKSSSSESTAFVRATRETGILGAGMYDWSTTGDEDWAPLANVRFNPLQTPALPLALPYAPAAGLLLRRQDAPQGGLLHRQGRDRGARAALPPVGRAGGRGPAGRQLAGRRRPGPRPQGQVERGPFPGHPGEHAEQDAQRDRLRRHGRCAGLAALGGARRLVRDAVTP